MTARAQRRAAALADVDAWERGRCQPATDQQGEEA